MNKQDLACIPLEYRKGIDEQARAVRNIRIKPYRRTYREEMKRPYSNKQKSFFEIVDTTINKNKLNEFGNLQIQKNFQIVLK